MAQSSRGDSAFDKVLGLNVTATFALTRDLTPMLERAGGGSRRRRHVALIGRLTGVPVEGIVSYDQAGAVKGDVSTGLDASFVPA